MDSKMYVCPLCNRAFERKSHFKRHMNSMHKISNEILNPEKKDAVLPSQYGLNEIQTSDDIMMQNYMEDLDKWYMESLHPEFKGIKVDIKCPICGNEYMDVAHLQHHLEKIHGMKQIGSGKKGKSQFYGKRSKVMLKVPSAVKKAAAYAYKLKKLGI
jgi:uncharacterized C2H2 Zn-finger protein